MLFRSGYYSRYSNTKHIKIAAKKIKVKAYAYVIVHGLGGGECKDGFFQCGEKIVTYCFGHILENFSPEDYDEKYKAWFV